MSHATTKATSHGHRLPDLCSGLWLRYPQVWLPGPLLPSANGSANYCLSPLLRASAFAIISGFRHPVYYVVTYVNRCCQTHRLLIPYVADAPGYMCAPTKIPRVCKPNNPPPIYNISTWHGGAIQYSARCVSVNILVSPSSPDVSACSKRGNGEELFTIAWLPKVNVQCCTRHYLDGEEGDIARKHVFRGLTSPTQIGYRSRCTLGLTDYSSCHKTRNTRKVKPLATQQLRRIMVRASASIQFNH